MKKRNNRFLAGTLAGLMMLTMLPVTALAAQGGADDDAASDTPNNNIVNVVSDGGNGQQAENNNVNVEENGGTENVQKSADDSSGDSENGQESADDNNDDSADTAAANQQEGENSGLSGGNTADTTPAEEPFVAKIGTQTYKTLDEAIEAVQGDEVIEVGEDCTLTVGTIEKAVVINGNGHTISVPEQNTENHALNINASLTFNKANVVFTNENAEWTVTMSGNGVLTLDEGSTCIIEKHGIYADNYATINVKGGSKMTVQNTSYTAMMADDGFANLNIEDDSAVVVDRAYRGDDVPNGINNFKIKVINSTLTVTNCENQGLVRCELTLDKSNAEISGNDTGITGYPDTDTLTLKNGSTLMMKDNIHCGIYMSGGKIDVQDGTKLTITGTGNPAEEDIITASYAGALCIAKYNPYQTNVEFADNATVELKDNAVSAIKNGGKVYVGANTVITNNGSKTEYGGGIQNYGEIIISADAQLYNNHAKIAGDDIYNSTFTKKGVTYNPSLTFAPVGDGWILDDCKEEHPIVGWYHDGKEKRWNGDGKDTEYYADEYEVKAEAVSDALALKAAHGQLCSVTYEVTGDIPSDAGAVPAAAKVKKGGSYTVAPVQTTSQSRYTFSGWRINGVGDVVTEIKDIQQDVKLIGVWTRRSSGGGGGSRKPTVDIPDDVPTGLNGDDHFAYIVGYPNGNVEPNGNITRAEVATIFFRLLTEEVRTANSTQSNSLSDVTRGQWFNHAVSTLSSMGIVKGHNDGTFAPNAPITRAEFAAIAARFDDKNTDTSSKFTDIASHWAKNEIGIAANKGWINGYPDGTFRPNQYITRAEAMTLVNRVLNRLPENSSDLLDSMIKWPDNSDASAWYYLAVQEATNSHAYSDKSKDDKYEKWTTIRDARDWTELEK
ncbi:S-layer homology domain-containing protein [Agathobaculum butyriciproducens]|uniref:S-layer homology domain-containing protein n=2 Tax=Agathobaculum butyriciproducens TaxID=1628085 RepID=A0AAW4VZV2_9FIRM|nr:S-layer homology domain-containing protein [Agathobaculum butyriciproducens]